MNAPLMTRAQYMGTRDTGEPYTEQERADRHRQYYAQFVNAATIRHVVLALGKATIQRAVFDLHFNSIPLKEWDALYSQLPIAMRFQDLGDFPSQAGYVCIAKEAARQFLEQGGFEPRKETP